MVVDKIRKKIAHPENGKITKEELKFVKDMEKIVKERIAKEQ